MSGKGVTWLLFFFLLLLIVMGCGRKAPPTLPEKPSSMIWKLETGNSIQKEVYLLKKLLFSHQGTKTRREYGYKLNKGIF